MVSNLNETDWGKGDKEESLKLMKNKNQTCERSRGKIRNASGFTQLVETRGWPEKAQVKGLKAISHQGEVLLHPLEDQDTRPRRH